MPILIFPLIYLVSNHLSVLQLNAKCANRGILFKNIYCRYKNKPIIIWTSSILLYSCFDLIQSVHRKDVNVIILLVFDKQISFPNHEYNSQSQLHYIKKNHPRYFYYNTCILSQRNILNDKFYQ